MKLQFVSGGEAYTESIRTSAFLKLLCKCQWCGLLQTAGQLSFSFLADAFQ